MEIPRLVHDELLQKLEEPREAHLLQAVHDLEHGARIVEDDVVDKSLVAPKHTEKTPLLMAGSHVVTVDSDLDLKELAMKLNEEEQAAVRADAALPAMEIIKSEFKQLLLMFLPLIFSFLMEQLPFTFQAMMVGRTDESRSAEILAAFSLAGLFQVITVVPLLNGIGTALDTKCAQAVGGKRFREMWMFVQASIVMMLVCAPFIIVIFANGATILKALGQDPVIADVTTTFLWTSLLSTPFLVLYSMQRSILQAQNHVNPVAAASLLAYVVSVPAAYALGFWTPLGYVGIALLNTINYIIKSLSLGIVLARHKTSRETWPGIQLREASRFIPKLLHLAGSGVLLVMFQLVGTTVIAFLVGLLPNAAVMMSANSIFSSALALAILPTLGISTAGSIRIGNALGAGQSRRASLVGQVTTWSCVTMGFLVMITAFAIKDPFVRSFTPDADTIHEALKVFQHLLFVFFLLGFVHGQQAVFLACGEQWLCAQLNFMFLFVLAVPLGMYFAFSLDMGVTGLWSGYVLGTFGLILGGGLWYYRLSWSEMTHKARLGTQLHVEERDTPTAAAF
ncbi:hypothetical protein Poli38472_002622 [Pythium oligandrum]|uniref:Multidrug and toxic compound extrusion protein n=1 Tax=Pythium oligandrum TaxID=41045 RepID=A0A8K1CHJ1_PYTOL|nr:hypothetical protein Poli38472_002622 [Pythium oligandrum]|eukprot:TMW63681.1 hypothetical protein Poli38472_002622 [Pythium oligandrum]